MIYGIKKREYKKEIQQWERQNISKYQNIKRGICIKLIDNLEKKLDRFLEMSKIDNEELKHFNHILGNIKAYLEGKIDKKELHSLTWHYDKKTIQLIYNIMDKVVKNTKSTREVKKVLKMIMRDKK